MHALLRNAAPQTVPCHEARSPRVGAHYLTPGSWWRQETCTAVCIICGDQHMPRCTMQQCMCIDVNGVPCGIRTDDQLQCQPPWLVCMHDGHKLHQEPMHYMLSVIRRK